MRDYRKNKINFLNLNKNDRKYYHIIIFCDSCYSVADIFCMKLICKNIKNDFYQNVLPGFSFF